MIWYDDNGKVSTWKGIHVKEIENISVRTPTVSGTFYPASERDLREVIHTMTPSNSFRRKAPAALSPHAGYVYSGYTAAELFAHIQIPDRVVLLGPNHTGMGARAGVYPSGAWEIPMGRVPVDGDLADRILKESEILTPDTLSHAREHSIEVQLPFLLYHNPRVRFVPICLGELTEKEAVTLGRDLAHVVRSDGEDTLFLASSDMTHYESQENARLKDRSAIRVMEALSPEDLIATVRRERISMCGYFPAAVAMSAARELGATRGELTGYRTSGDVSGDFSAVVGYAGMTFW